MRFEEVTYYSKKDLNKGTNKMIKKGWIVHDIQTKKERPLACCFPLLGLFSFLQVKTYVVIYKR